MKRQRRRTVVIFPPGSSLCPTISRGVQTHVEQTKNYYGKSEYQLEFDKNLLKDIQQLTLNCLTGSLEVYHSVLTKYHPKHQHFLFKDMFAPSQQAALDHNANTSRDHATVSSEDLHYKVVFPKRSKEWVAEATKQKTKRDDLQPMLDAIVERKNQDAAERSATITAPHIPHNIVNTSRPDKADIIAKHTSRFSAS